MEIINGLISLRSERSFSSFVSLFDHAEIGTRAKKQRGRGDEVSFFSPPLSSPFFVLLSPHFARVQKYGNRLFSAETSTETFASQATHVFTLKEFKIKGKISMNYSLKTEYYLSDSLSSIFFLFMVMAKRF